MELYDAGDPSRLIARSYQRVVFGDHGPYVECDPSEIVGSSLFKLSSSLLRSGRTCRRPVMSLQTTAFGAFEMF